MIHHSPCAYEATQKYFFIPPPNANPISNLRYQPMVDFLTKVFRVSGRRAIRPKNVLFTFLLFLISPT